MELWPPKTILCLQFYPSGFKCNQWGPAPHSDKSEAIMNCWQPIHYSSDLHGAGATLVFVKCMNIFQSDMQKEINLVNHDNS